MNKKLLYGLMLPMLAVVLVSAVVLVYYGQIELDIEAKQAITLNGGDFCEDYACEEDLGTVYSPDTIISGLYVLTNHDPDNSREVSLDSECEADTLDCDGVTTTYLKEVPYSYGETNIAGLDVKVEDTNDGWLQWTYTGDSSTRTEPKMTVEINYPTGFGVTTFDDGGHDGWHYYDTTTPAVKFAERVGGAYSDFVETTIVGNVMTVKIKKSALGNEFKWHGYGNFYNGQIWINTDENGLCENTACGPTFEATIREELTSPFTMSADSELGIFIKNNFNIAGTDSYIITTEAIPTV